MKEGKNGGISINLVYEYIDDDDEMCEVKG